MRAVIRHQSQNSNAESGHYTIIRKHNDKWSLLDDKVVTIKTRQLEDHGRHGKCAMVLLKKVGIVSDEQ